MYQHLGYPSRGSQRKKLF